MAPSIQTYQIRRATGAAARRDEWSGTRRRERRAPPPTTAAPRVYATTIGGKSFAGVRDDPFFFDLPGFVQFKGELLKGNTTLGVAGRRRGTLLGGSPATIPSPARTSRASLSGFPTSTSAGPDATSASGPRRRTRRRRARSRSTAWAGPRSTPSSTASTSRPRAR